MKTIQSKIKVTKSALKVLMFRKLHRRGIGTDTVEGFVRKEYSLRGTANSRRINLVSKIMMLKVQDAQEEEVSARREFKNCMSYLEKR